MSQGICMEGENEKGLLEHAKRISPPPFLLKTHMLVEDPATDDIISWNEHGTGFVVWQPAEFARDLLPTLFKHSNFSSFVRQLNTYGFRKAASGRWEFHNEMFRRGGRELLCEIHRRKAWANKHTAAPTKTLRQESDDDHGSSSTSSSMGQGSLYDENQRLKRENGVLCLELVSMKNKCKELLDLVMAYAKSEDVVEDERPKLFGVRLEVQGEKKRKRAEISENIRALLSQSCK
ncbi:heat stress transcription factor B-3 [Magnolia sinica]|uniref:heat stress transcription factor B-3 n=1 Tax=Magnolia sinica TaxID=86752 RepID=UPI002657F552|nr:heat stress transcription factor B-3 [Magnolia sinica]